MRKTKQIKSKERVSKFAEVFTAEREVKAMCDLIPEWTIDNRVLEPSCGTGNFLVEIIQRKFKLCKNPKEGLKALNSIFGIDIQKDNVQETKERLLKIYCETFPEYSKEALLMAVAILNNNIICGDSLQIMNKLGVQN